MYLFASLSPIYFPVPPWNGKGIKVRRKGNRKGEGKKNITGKKGRRELRKGRMKGKN
jgi:hypothetical protein